MSLNSINSTKIGYVYLPTFHGGHSLCFVANRKWNVDSEYSRIPGHNFIITIYKKSHENLIVGLLACISPDSLKYGSPIITFDSTVLMFHLVGTLSPYFWHLGVGLNSGYKYQLNVFTIMEHGKDIWKNAIIKFMRLYDIPYERNFQRYNTKYKNIFCSIKIGEEEIK